MFASLKIFLDIGLSVIEFNTDYNQQFRRLQGNLKIRFEDESLLSKLILKVYIFILKDLKNHLK
ncbi:hypothetical protein CWC30_17890 [Pseudoalteromonas sp. S4741]|nr:hypothetical protein CWC30_17890 [Pseudoalteromonas sp. S4741]